MTLLYRCDATARQIAAAFGARQGNDPWSGGYGAPGSFLPVVTAGREFIAGPRPAGRKLEARIVPRIWGVPPLRSDGSGGRQGILTVRNLASPFWIGNLRNAEFRCLIPATAFMEWGRNRDVNGKREQHWISLSDQPLFVFAGVWKDSEVPSFAMLTCEPNAAMRRLDKENMPVALPPEPDAFDKWLHADWKTAQKLVQPYSSSLMRIG